MIKPIKEDASELNFKVDKMTENILEFEIF